MFNKKTPEVTKKEQKILADSINAHQLELEKLQKDIEATSDAIKVVDETLVVAEKDLEKVSKQVDIEKDLLADILKEKQDFIDEIMEIGDDIIKAKSELKKVEVVLETQASTNDDRQNAADAQYEEKMAVNNALMVEQNEKIVALQAKVDSLMFASESIDTQNAEKKKEEIKTLNKELKELKEETESSSNQLESFKQESAIVSAEVTVLEFNKKELVEEIATLEKDSKVAEEKMQKATTELESKMKEKIALADRTEALNQREEHIKSAYKKAGITYEPLT
jgi:chromosome segregation ATPase